MTKFMAMFPRLLTFVALVTLVVWRGGEVEMKLSYGRVVWQLSVRAVNRKVRTSRILYLVWFLPIQR